MKKKRDPIHIKAELAMKEAIKEVVERHRKSGIPLAVWKNGKVVLTHPGRKKNGHSRRTKRSRKNS